MKILITNDDGIEAEGIAVLAKRLARENEVWVVAPHRNRSGVSHCITMDKPLLIEKRETVNGVPCGEHWYSLEGFPADCVITALRGSFLPGFPDMVISGINSDANLGTDVIYSGTCAAARQAGLYGVPGIALSLCHGSDHGDGEKSNYEPLADFAAKHLQYLAGLCNGYSAQNGMALQNSAAEQNAAGNYGAEPLSYFVNVNALSLGKPGDNSGYKGMVLAGLSNREYKDSVEIETSGGKQYSVFRGGRIVSHGDGSDDYSVVQKGYVAVSVLHTEAVCCDGMGQQFVC